MQMKKPSTNPSLSQFGDTFRNGSEVLSKSTATVKKLIANNLKHHLLENDSKNNHTIKKPGLSPGFFVLERRYKFE